MPASNITIGVGDEANMNPKHDGFQLLLLPDNHDHFNQSSLDVKVQEYKLMAPRALRKGKLHAVTASKFMMQIRFQECYSSQIRNWATRGAPGAPRTRWGEWKKLLTTVAIFILLLWIGTIVGLIFPLPVGCNCVAELEGEVRKTATVGFDSCIKRYQHFYLKNGPWQHLVLNPDTGDQLSEEEMSLDMCHVEHDDSTVSCEQWQTSE
eukprot:SAG31_NODE_7955_length_1555_cov_1.592720_1_plen_207_part_10